jgi:hypothetical protein
MDPTTIMTVPESVLSFGMVEPAVIVASVLSLAASKVTIPDERGGEDEGMVN